MAFQAAPNIVKVEMRFSQQGQLVENVFHVRMTVAINPASLDVIAGVFATWWTTDMAPQVSTGLTLNSVLATDLSTDTGISIEHTTGLPASGTNPAAQPPMNVTVAIKWTTSSGGRSYRGRSYHLGLVNDQLANSTIIPAAVTMLHNQYLLLVTDVNSTGNPMVVLSRRHNKALRPTGVGTDIVSVLVDNTTDSQRRRLPGRGR
jgi:hypothetical protein